MPLPQVAPQNTAVAKRGTNALVFQGKSLPPALLAQAYQNYADTYNIATGRAWSFDKFKAYNKKWIFFGTIDGYVAVRPQRTGPLKLVVAAGDVNSPAKDKSMLMAFTQILKKKLPIWGLVTPKISQYIVRLSRGAFIALDGGLLHDLLDPITVEATVPGNANKISFEFPPLIPAMVISGSRFQVDVMQDGVDVNDDELGSTGLKKFIADKNWFLFTGKELAKKIGQISSDLTMAPEQEALNKAYVRELLRIIARIESVSGVQVTNLVTGSVQRMAQIESFNINAKMRIAESLKKYGSKPKKAKKLTEKKDFLQETFPSRIGREVKKAIDLGFSTPDELLRSTDTLAQGIKEELMRLGAWHFATGFEKAAHGNVGLKLWKRFAGDMAEAIVYPGGKAPGYPSARAGKKGAFKPDEKDLNKFVKHYLIAALWSSTDDEGEPLDKTYGIEDLDKEVTYKAKKECGAFLAEAGEILMSLPSEEYTLENAAHDFWLTRNGHGAGFWDATEKEIPKDKANTLTKMAKKFKPIDLYVGDDEKIHGT